MTSEYVEEKRDDKKIEKLIKVFSEIAKGNKLANLIDQISKVFKGISKEKITLSKESAELGLLLLNQNKDFQDTGTSHWDKEPKPHTDLRWDGKRIEGFAENFDDASIWENHYDLLEVIFGEEIAPQIKTAWENIPNFMYQRNWSRRSFTRPNHAKTALFLRLRFLTKCINSNAQFDLSLLEFAQYEHYAYDYIEFILAAAIDNGNDELYEQLADILQGKAEVGSVSRTIIKAFLLSKKPEAWTAIEKLLLAAQRQEGLRQTILECLDETSLGAMKHLIKVILDNKLTRFSSVVRAVDVWAGFDWEAEKESTVKRFLTLGYQYLSNPETIAEAIKDKDNAAVYMALWAQGVIDIDQCYPLLKTLTDEKNTIGKQALAYYFVNQADIDEWELEFGLQALKAEYENVIYWSFVLLNRVNDLKSKAPEVFEISQQLFEKLPEKKTFDSKLFSWLTFSVENQDALSLLINATDFDKEEQVKILVDFKDKMNLNNREKLVKTIFKTQNSWRYENLDKDKKKPTTFQREFAFSILKDRSEYIRNEGLTILQYAGITPEELPIFEDLLSRKAADFRKTVLQLITKNDDSIVLASAERLINAKALEQRLAGLDLLNQLKIKKQKLAEIKILANNFLERKRINSKEQILIDKLLNEAEIYNRANGFGIFNPENITSAAAPEIPKKGEFAERQKGKNPYGLSMSMKAIDAEIEKLKALFIANKDYEYTIDYGHEKSRVLLGNNFRSKIQGHKGLSDRERFETYPLFEIWEKWLEESKLTGYDLFRIDEAFQAQDDYYNDDEKPKFPNSLKSIGDFKFMKDIPKMKGFYDYYWSNPICNIFSALKLIKPYEHKTAYFQGASNFVLASLDLEEVKSQAEKGNHVFSEDIFSYPLNQYQYAKKTDEEFKAYWQLVLWRLQNIPRQNEKETFVSLEDFCRAYKANLCTKDEFFDKLMETRSIQVLIKNPRRTYWNKEGDKLKEEFPFLEEMIDVCRDRIIEIELKRGDTVTPVSHLASAINTLYGIDNLQKILAALGKDTLNRGYYWGDNKKAILSQFLKSCHPTKNETQADFDAMVKAAKLTDKKLVEIALYAQQWLPFVAKNLNWKGMEKGVWWLHAHANEYSKDEMETEIAKYSKVSTKDFSDGAVDADWFTAAYKLLGKPKWTVLYNAAKYISDGTGHNRAKLYADVILGNIKIREITKKVKDKRNQDYLRMFGLVPLSKKTPDKDVLSRYNYLMQFKKESRQFGSQRQTSEGLAVRIALENLARAAGYPDPIRLTWAMETEEAKNIIEAAEKLTFGNVTVELQVDEFGKSSIICMRGDKVLQSVPTKINKEKAVQELKEFHKKLKNQYSRSRKSLEDAMVRGDEFLARELLNLATHPVIAPMLKSLVFVNEKGHGFLADGALENHKGESVEILDNTRLVHCTDLYENKTWSEYQKLCFDKQIKQPFKQIFRELYVPTKDELAEKSISRRYAGHQVQPKKTIALLKTRHWTVDHQEGLQKVYHKEGFIAKMYAMADWFSPADVESPTLETVQFISQKTYKRIPFEEINARIFSEVMRDVDLVVSVAHVGGVDPEASHSTIEMRSVILTETARLFKLNNVSIKGNHAIIKGTKGDYNVHIGSGVTHRLPGKYLSILPVHSQHRGRLFLPFIDEDPKSAEIMSKVLLLAKDKEIQDPTILSQLKD